MGNFVQRAGSKAATRLLRYSMDHLLVYKKYQKVESAMLALRGLAKEFLDLTEMDSLHAQADVIELHRALLEQGVSEGEDADLREVLALHQTRLEYWVRELANEAQYTPDLDWLLVRRIYAYRWELKQRAMKWSK